MLLRLNLRQGRSNAQNPFRSLGRRSSLRPFHPLLMFWALSVLVLLFVQAHGLRNITVAADDQSAWRFSPAGTGSWIIPVDLPGCNGETLIFSKTIGSSASITFTGVAAYLQTTIAPDRGVIRVELDGKFQGDINAWSDGSRHCGTLFSRTGLEDSEHTLKLTLKAAHGDATKFEIASFIYTQSEPQDINPTSSPARTADVTSGDPRISYFPPDAWRSQGGVICENGLIETRATSQPGAKLVFGFIGLSISLKILNNSTAPYFVSLDGAPGKLFNSSGLHTITCPDFSSQYSQQGMNDGGHIIVIWLPSIASPSGGSGELIFAGFQYSGVDARGTDAIAPPQSLPNHPPTLVAVAGVGGALGAILVICLCFLYYRRWRTGRRSHSHITGVLRRPAENSLSSPRPNRGLAIRQLFLLSRTPRTIPITPPPPYPESITRSQYQPTQPLQQHATTEHKYSSSDISQ